MVPEELRMAHYPSIDDCLGPAGQRFFSEGHKRVSRALTDVVVEAGAGGPGVTRGTGTLTYPADWSRKTTSLELRPHLSSLDALLLGLDAAEASLVTGYGLSEAQRRRCWLRGWSLRGGTTPQEEMTGVPVVAQPVSARAEPFSLAGFVTVYDCTIGGIRLQCEIEHEAVPEDGSAPPFPATVAGNVEELLGAAPSRHFGTGYKLRQQTIRDVLVDPRGQAANATVAVTVGDEATGAGIGAGYQPSLSMVDCMSVMAQLAQVLFYQQDGVDRGSTNTLWMRRVAMRSNTPWQPLANPFVVDARVDRTDLAELHGGTWRVTRMVGNFQGIRAQTSLAHLLPLRSEPEMRNA